MGRGEDIVGTFADLQTMSIGLLLLRVVVGLIMAAHGAQKLLGWFGGYGLRGTGEFFVQLAPPSSRRRGTDVTIYKRGIGEATSGNRN
jgi:uncharacterized membrane protein YphA (DoxX/SURF4 family)